MTSTPVSKRWLCAVLAVVLTAGLAACSDSPKPAPEAAKPAAPKPPQVPPEMQAVAEASLGSDVTVLAWGNLSLGGSRQVLAANLLKSTPKGVVPGNLLTRAVILSESAGKWQEVLRVDEHLKNPKGFLGGTPIAGISGWRLQYEMSKEKGISMYFTPLQQPASGAVRPIGVLWNPKVMRYQSLDRNYENFLGEVAQLEKVERYMR